MQFHCYGFQQTNVSPSIDESDERPFDDGCAGGGNVCCSVATLRQARHRSVGANAIKFQGSTCFLDTNDDTDVGTSPTRSHWTSLGLDRHERTSTLSFPPSPAAAMKMTSARAESLGARLYVVPRGDRLLLKQKTVQAVRTHF
jgi:hypothetical protein